MGTIHKPASDAHRGAYDVRRRKPMDQEADGRNIKDRIQHANLMEMDFSGLRPMHSGFSLCNAAVNGFGIFLGL